LEEERALLARLDALPSAAPSRSLTAEVMERIRAENAAPRRRTLGAAVAVAAAAVAVVIALQAYRIHDHAARERAAMERLRQWGVIFHMYAAEDKQGRYPPLTPYDGLWMADLETLYPEYLSNPEMLVNPRRPGARTQEERVRKLFTRDEIPWREVTRIAAENYSYPGHALTSEEELRRLVETGPVVARVEASAAPLQEGVERFFITDINNPAAIKGVAIPVLVARPPEGAKAGDVGVLYMDGRVERLPLGGRYPATPETLELLSPPPAGG
jgi:hypothetical protein